MPLSVCTITGTAYYADGTIGDAGIYLVADQATLDGTVLGTAAQTFYAAAGVITLLLPRGSTVRLTGTVRGFHEALTVAIPDTATADLEDLIPVQYSGSLPQGLGTGSTPTFNTSAVQVEGKLATVTGVDLDTTSAATLFTCPAGKSCVVTRAIIRDASASLVGMSGVLAFKSGIGTIMRQTISTSPLTTSLRYLQMFPGQTDDGVFDYLNNRPVIITAGTTLDAQMSAPSGAPATVTIDVFGYLI